MKNRKIGAILLTLVIVLGTITACSSPNEVVKDITETTDLPNWDEDFGITETKNTVSLVDGTGKEITLDKYPERVVILFTSFIDIWYRNGGELVGMVESSSPEIEIPGTEGVETVGKTGAISLEKIISLEPDLVILSSNTSSQMELQPQLKQNDIPVLAFDYKFKNDYYMMAKLFSALNGREDLFEENAIQVEKDIQEIIDKIEESEDGDIPRIFLMFASSKGLKSRGGESTVGEIFADLHTINISDESSISVDDQIFSMEKLIEEDPDYIFVLTMGSDMEQVQDRIKADAESNPAWASLSAVQNDRYIFLPKDLFTYKANHRYAEAYEYIAKIIYPELFN